MTSKFDQTFHRLLKEGNAITGGNVGGNTYGSTAGNSQPSRSVPQSSAKTPTISQQAKPYKKINLRMLDPNKNKTFATYDFAKQDRALTPDKVNSSEYVNNLTNNILAGRNVHPSHLGELAGVLEANPDIIPELKKKGINSDLIKQSYLKQGTIGSQTNIDQNLENRYKNLFR